MDYDATWYGGRPGPRRLCTRLGPSSPPQKRGGDPNLFSAHVYCGQTTGWLKITLGIEVGLGPGHIVLDGDPAPLPKKGTEPPIFSLFLLWPNGWMHQHATWYGGRPRPRPHCVSWGPSTPTQKGAQPAIFGPCLLRKNSCIYQDTTWCGGRSQPRRHCVRWGPSSPPLKGHSLQFSVSVRCG